MNKNFFAALAGIAFFSFNASAMDGNTRAISTALCAKIDAALEQTIKGTSDIDNLRETLRELRLSSIAHEFDHIQNESWYKEDATKNKLVGAFLRLNANAIEKIMQISLPTSNSHNNVTENLKDTIRNLKNLVSQGNSDLESYARTLLEFSGRHGYYKAQCAAALNYLWKEHQVFFYFDVLDVK